MKLISGNKKREIVEQVLLQNYNKYYRLAYSYVHNEADAGDIVQNGAYKAILNSSKLRNIEFVETWIYRIMVNEIFQNYRGQTDLLPEDSIPEKGKEDVYQNLDLKRALDSLEKEDKTVIILRYYEDMRLEDIAIVLNENLSTIKSRLYRSMKKLKLKLEPYEESIR